LPEVTTIFCQKSSYYYEKQTNKQIIPENADVEKQEAASAMTSEVAVTHRTAVGQPSHLAHPAQPAQAAEPAQPHR